MRPTQADQIHHEIERLEVELAALRGGGRQTKEAQQRLAEIGVTIERLRVDAAKLKGS